MAPSHNTELPPQCGNVWACKQGYLPIYANLQEVELGTAPPPVVTILNFLLNVASLSNAWICKQEYLYIYANFQGVELGYTHNYNTEFVIVPGLA